MPMRSLGSAVILRLSLLLVVVASPLEAIPRQQAAEIASPERSFIGPDGNPLPFKNDAEVMEFMLAARVIDETSIGVGINQSQRVTLEKDGIRARAIFREVDLTRRNHRVGGVYYWVFRDSYLFEPAAYQLALRIGITNVPPAVRRQIGRRDGSMQIWIEDVRDAESEVFKPPDIAAWVRQLRDMILLDNLIYNVDRNKGNTLVTTDYTIAMIDHTRGFQERRTIMDAENLTIVNRDTWEKLRNLPDEGIQDAVRPYLTADEIGQLLIRRRAIIDHIEALIEERGENMVVVP